jgi:mRNA-degrading endonuclease RelE of RelBE toxin-antitoxin system
VYEVLVERTAERDLKSLPSTVFDRIVTRIKALAEVPRPSGCHKLAGSRMIGEFGSGIIEFFMKSMIPANA